MRTTRETVTFDRAFSLQAVDVVQPAGAYTVEIDEDLIVGLSFLVPTRRDHDLSAGPLRRRRLGAGRSGRSSSTRYSTGGVGAPHTS